MSTAQRLAFVLVGILVVVGIAVVALRAVGAEIGLGPNPSGAPTSSPTGIASPSPTSSVDAEPSAPSAQEVLAILAEIEEQVIAIRGLEAADIGLPEIITRRQLAEELQRLFDQSTPPDERERDNIALRALGLLGAEQDAAELQLQMLGDTVLGFYDHTRQRMVVVSDAGLDVAAQITYAHEYTHALQDATFGLDSLQMEAAGEDDRGLARLSLVEGDAYLTMLAWMFRHMSQEEILAYFASLEVPDTSGVPSWVPAHLLFPAEAGLTWASAVAGGDPTNPDFTEIDAAFDNPPDSTEQIIDPAKWSPREAPDPLESVDLAAALGDGWQEVDATTIGQASIAITLEYFGVSVPDARGAAEGWGGDRAVIATGPDDAFAVGWRLSWDTAADAGEFADAYETVVASLEFPASVTELPNGDVLVAHASTEELLASTVDAAD